MNRNPYFLFSGTFASVGLPSSFAHVSNTRPTDHINQGPTVQRLAMVRVRVKVAPNRSRYGPLETSTHKDPIKRRRLLYIDGSITLPEITSEQGEKWQHAAILATDGMEL